MMSVTRLMYASTGAGLGGWGGWGGGVTGVVQDSVEGGP